jgi:hypothetical protein
MLWMPEFTGTYAWRALRAESAAATVAAVNLDMVGESQADCGSTFLLEQAPHFLGSFADELLARIRSAAQDWVRDFSGAGHYSLARMAEVPYSGGSDHALWLDPTAGVPCPMLIQWPDRYYHTDLDTPERCDPDSLALAARTAAAYAGFVAALGPAELPWLLDLVARGARRRLLAALDRPDRWATCRAERERGQCALASVQRFTIGQAASSAIASALKAHLPHAVESLEGFGGGAFAPELARGPARAGVAPPAIPPPGRVPQPLGGALPPPMRWLAEGWERLDERARSRMLALEASIPGGSTALDLAWFACDGERGVGDIAAMLAREGWPVTPAVLEEWFDLAAAIGFTAWRS